MSAPHVISPRCLIPASVCPAGSELVPQPIPKAINDAINSASPRVTRPGYHSGMDLGRMLDKCVRDQWSIDDLDWSIPPPALPRDKEAVSYTHLRAHETD